MENNSAKQGKLIVFTSAKGGVGKTTLATNTACYLAKKVKSTAIIDGSFQFGDVNLTLDLKPKLVITDLVQDAKALNPDMLNNYMLQHECGLEVLSAPQQPELADLVTPDALKIIISSLLIKYNYVVADLCTGTNETNLVFLELATKIYIVTDLGMASLRNTKNLLKVLRLLGFVDKAIVVVNRYDTSDVVKYSDASTILGYKEIIGVCTSNKIVSRSLNTGIPFVLKYKNEKVTKDISSLISSLVSKRDLAMGEEASGRKFFGLFGGN